MELRKLEQSQLPTNHGQFEMTAYESGVKDFPHLVLRNSITKDSDVIDVRIHSECLTGDLFGSSRCDCGEQLNSSLDYFGENGGILIYLRQEGRGIGLINKMKAYNLQDGGMDTIKANHALGFHTDERSFDIALEILKDLKVSKINLWTNNPKKIKAFEDSGITVVKRIPILVESNEFNTEYLKVKKDQMGHWLNSID